MKEIGVAQVTETSVEEKTRRMLKALEPLVADAIVKNNIRRGAKFNDIEGNSAAVGDVVARALMEAASVEFGRATDEEVEEARRRALELAGPELAKKLGGEAPRVVRQMRERTIATKRGPVRCRREYLHFPDLRVGLFPPRLSD
jgi:hypothetical protein